MTGDPILKAWVWLLALSGVSALVAQAVGLGIDRRITGAVILLLAVAKSRVILARYLGLDQAPGWLSGVMTVLGLFALLALGLYLAPLLG